MFNITQEMLLNLSSSEIFEQGREYYRARRIKSVQFNQDKLAFNATVLGTRLYDVRLQFEAAGRLAPISAITTAASPKPSTETASASKPASVGTVLYSCSGTCTCSDFAALVDVGGFCKHLIALLLLIEEKDKQGFFRELRFRQAAKEIFSFFGGKQAVLTSQVTTEAFFELPRNDSHGKAGIPMLSLRLGQDKLYVVKDLKRLMENIERNEDLQLGRKFTFSPSRHVFDKADQPLIDLIFASYETSKLMETFSPLVHGTGFFRGKQLLLTDSAVKRFFEMTAGRPFRARLHDMDFDDLTVVEKDIPVEFQLGGEGSDLLLNISIEGVIFPITADGEYFYAGGAIHRISEQQQEYLKPFYLAMLSQKGRKLRFIDEDRERFVSEILPFAEKAGTLVISDEVMSIMERVPLEAEIYLDREDRDIAAEVRFIYGDKVINPFLSAVKSETKSEKLLIRDIIREEAILDLLAASDFRVKEGRINLSGEDNIYDFVFTLVPKLQDYAMIYYSDSLRSMTIRTAVSITSRFKLNNESDMLDFSFNIEGIDNEEISGIMASLVHRKKYHRLKNGSMLNLASREFSQLGYFINQMELEKADFNNDYLELPKYRALYLDQLLRDTGLHNVERDHAFKEFVQNVKEPGDTSYSLPPNLNGTLREYQKFGFKWLRTLDTYGLGGILADDMGLGKTIQMMALLLSVKNEAARGNGDADGNGDAGEIGGAGEIAGAGEIGGAGESAATTPQPTSLIVVPTSLVFNWCAELDRFAPDLVYKIVTGNKQERLAIISSASEADILITSYPLIRRDIEAYEDIRFRFCILDEAQHIKNPDSQNSHAVKRINAVRRFAMTGTPMENNLAELWSIFDFVLPGYLHTRAKFTEKYASAAGDEETAEILRELSRQIKPFTLRRLKKDVLDELPEKIEHTMLADITEEQKKVYLAFLSRIKGEIKQEIEEKGFEKSQIKILAALTRLRQICCHPSLFLEDFEGESGKLQLLEEILSDALESDHRILIFSQFTSMLQIIRKRLEEKEIETLYLDGSTPAAERGVLVNSFNGGKGKVFLLSLKAGGSGLNLTGADTVIHFDPWWNPAVEDQATDRSYRIGQNRSVHVMKLVTRGTIEEKILKLQDKKRELIDAVIQPGETLITKMTREDIEALFD